MYYIAVLAPDNRIVKVSSPTMLQALGLFNDAWNKHVKQFGLVGLQRFNPISDLDNRRYEAFADRQDKWIVTSSKMAWECFIDTAADEAHGG